MMTIKKITLFAFVCLNLFSFAQKKVEPDHVYLYKETSLETDDYKIYFVSPQNEFDYAKFKIRIFNKTNDYLIFKPNEFSFLIGGQGLSPKGKQIMVPPNEEESKVINVEGKACQVDKYTFEIKTYYKVMNDVPGIQVEDFSLPPSKNDLKVRPFDCKHLDNTLKKEKSVIKFSCSYHGDGIGILDPYKCSAIMPGGKENANSRQYKPLLLEKGKEEVFLIEFKSISGAGDMEKDAFKIKWNETFKDSKLTSMPGSKVDIEIDQKKTEEKNN